jgi:WhiB family redox-sensing transcriptional regulator
MTPAELAERDRRVVEWRARGWSHERIGAELRPPMSRRGVASALKRIARGGLPRDSVLRPARDVQVLALLGSGIPRREVAERLHIDVRSVDRVAHDARRFGVPLGCTGTLSAVVVVATVTRQMSLADLLLPDADGEWWAGASCAQVGGDVFFPEKGGNPAAAKRICQSCPVRDAAVFGQPACLEYALAHDERFGIWGGLSERERRRLRRNTDTNRSTTP